MLWLVIIIQPLEDGGEKKLLSLPHHTPPPPPQSGSNMRLGLSVLFLSLAKSCWCAPQQSCPPGDEFSGEVASASEPRTTHVCNVKPSSARGLTRSARGTGPKGLFE